ncbi:MAG: hypothetical protein AAGJ81_03625 [Verrucomicrobiota bacterium]
MSDKTRKELLPRLRQRYVGRGREGKTLMLDEFCEQWQCDRKHAIKLLNGTVGWGGQLGVKRGSPPIYGPEVVEVLESIWRVAEQPCGKRLKELLPLWLPHYEEGRGKLPKALRRKVLRISAARIDRVLSPKKAGPHGLCGTKPGSILRSNIAVRTDNFDIDRPGYLEADTVAHCGGSLSGDFIWSVTYTDIHSGWTCNRAVWNKGYTGVMEATKGVEEKLPFPLLGFDSDNGGEFLNWHLVHYLQERDQPVSFTRSRPYKKNDNAHVEQKNWSHVRQLLGYDRLDNPQLCPLINSLYRDYWEPLNNFFMPSFKLVEKIRQGSKIKKRHDKPMTPCDRLLLSEHIDARTKTKLRKTRKQLNPFKLAEKLENALNPILSPMAGSGQPTASLHRPLEIKK